MAKPTIVFVPGAWHSPDCFSPTSALLEAQGYKFRGVTLYVFLAPYLEQDTVTRDWNLTDPLQNTLLPASGAGVAGGVADEVEVVGAGGAHGRSKSRNAGIGDRAWRQTGMFVGVVGRWGLEIGGVDSAAPAIVE